MAYDFYRKTDFKKTLTKQYNEILTQLKFAESLGAITQVLIESDIANAIVGYARKNNLSKVIGSDLAYRKYWFCKSLMQKITQLAPELDLIQIAEQTQKIGKTAQSQ